MRNGKSAGSLIRAEQFSPITFYDSETKRQIIILYSLGEDGVIREFANGKWTPFPILDEPVPATVAASGPVDQPARQH